MPVCRTGCNGLRMHTYTLILKTPQKVHVDVEALSLFIKSEYYNWFFNGSETKSHLISRLNHISGEASTVDV